jgi:hypothetical protein
MDGRDRYISTFPWMCSVPTQTREFLQFRPCVHGAALMPEAWLNAARCFARQSIRW